MPIGISMGLVLAVLLQIRKEVSEKVNKMFAEEEDDNGSGTDDK